MNKVRLFINKDMTVIDCGQEDTSVNFHSYDREIVIANVIKIEKIAHGAIVYTDYRNPFRDKCATFLLNDENFNLIRWC